MEYDGRKAMLLAALDEVQSMHDSLTFQEFVGDWRNRRAASKCLEIVGECMHVGQREGKPHASNSTTDWFYGLRNQLAHVYNINAVSDEDLWAIMGRLGQQQVREEVESYVEPPERPAPEPPAPETPSSGCGR